MTVVIGNIPATNTDVAIPILDQTKLKIEPRMGQSSPDGNNISVVYKYEGSDPTYETFVTVGFLYIPASDATRRSVKLTLTESNDVSGETVKRPLIVSLEFTTPGRYMGSPQQVLDAIGSLYSLCFVSLVSKEPQLEVLNALNYGRVSGIYNP